MKLITLRFEPAKRTEMSGGLMGISLVATQEWWDRYAAYSEELATFEKKRRKKKADNLTTQTD